MIEPKYKVGDRVMVEVLVFDVPDSTHNDYIVTPEGQQPMFNVSPDDLDRCNPPMVDEAESPDDVGEIYNEPEGTPKIYDGKRWIEIDPQANIKLSRLRELGKSINFKHRWAQDRCECCKELASLIDAIMED